MSEAEATSSHWLRQLSLGDAQASWGWAVAIGVGLLLDLAVQVAAVGLLDSAGLLDATGVTGLVTAQAVALGGLLPIIIYLKLNRRSVLRSLLLLKPKLSHVWLAFKGASIYVPLTLVGLSFVGLFAPDMLEVSQELGVETGVVGVELVVAFVALVILTPVIEEVIYRGFIFRGIAKSSNAWAGVIISSLIFGAVHGQLALAADTFVLGVVCAVLVARSGSLWPAITLHGLKNGLAFFLLFIQPLL